jgi:hypothetical protein
LAGGEKGLTNIPVSDLEVGKIARVFMARFAGEDPPGRQGRLLLTIMAGQTTIAIDRHLLVG